MESKLSCMNGLFFFRTGVPQSFTVGTLYFLRHTQLFMDFVARNELPNKMSSSLKSNNVVGYSGTCRKLQIEVTTKFTTMKYPRNKCLQT